MSMNEGTKSNLSTAHCKQRPWVYLPIMVKSEVAGNFTISPPNKDTSTVEQRVMSGQECTIWSQRVLDIRQVLAEKEQRGQ